MIKTYIGKFNNNEQLGEHTFYCDDERQYSSNVGLYKKIKDPDIYLIARFTFPIDPPGYALGFELDWQSLGVLHRVDGPAIIGKHRVYYLYGKYYNSKEAWYEALTPEQKKKVIWKLHEL